MQACRLAVTAGVADESGKALESVGGDEVGVDCGCNGERFPGVAFGLRGLTLCGRDTSAGGEHHGQVAARRRRYGLVGPPTGTRIRPDSCPTYKQYVC